jgi:lipopolysaccharide export system protein LptA
MAQVFSIRRLRWVLVAGVLATVAVLAVFIAKGHFFRPKIHINLKKYGIDVTTDSDSVTYSHTNLGVTQYTVHAAKRIQHKDGKVTLRDVGIVLYGAKGDRRDRIHGNEFEYDEKNGIMTAVGEVFIDLAPPGKQAAGAKPDDEIRMVHLRTNDLVFRQKEQVATTASRIEFMTGGVTGNAMGASYDAANEIIVLQSEVHASGLRGRGAKGGERPMVLTAAHAEIDMEDEQQKEAGNVAFLESPKLVEATEHGTETGLARHAVVHMSADGTPKQVLADGSVTLIGEGRGTLTSDKLELDLGPAGEPTATHLSGSVRFANQLQAKHETGKADDARVAFDKEGRPVHALMVGSVEASVAEGESTRWLGADRLELELAGGGKQPVEVRAAQATAGDGARMRMVDAKAAKGKTAAGIVTANVKADVLNAKFAPGVKKTLVTAVDGTGKTLIERTFKDRATGAQAWKETGAGDTLRIDFHQVTGDDAKSRSEIARAEQRGSVKIVRDALASKPGAANEVEHADGDDAVYEADTDAMTLTGQVKVSDAESAMFADRVAFDRSKNEATAEGAVRVSYLQPGSTGEPVHVLASRAVGHKATGVTEFFGGTGGDAKLWQGGSQVTAPVLYFDRTKRTVFAHGANGSSAQPVKTVLVDNNPPKPGAKQQAPVRVLSREMTYTDATREVVFRGPVQLNDQDGVLRAKEATVYLTPKDAAPTHGDGATMDGAQISLGGKVDHMIAVGAVEIEQPGRKATGERLVYTASDRLSVLTGTKAVPPKMVDETQGSVTGAQLRFRSGDDSVEVVGGDGVEHVHTVTKMKQKD